MAGAIGGMMAGSVVPWLWGDYNSFGLMSVVCGMIGGFVGIWLGVKLAQVIDG